MNNNPLVSIIVRTKDRPKLLERALRSISAQTYRPIEVVLVNDGGCDLNESTIKDILKDISLNYIRLKENKGRAYAGNVGIENAKGEYIGFLDDDDELYANHLSLLVPILQMRTYKIAYTDANIVYLVFDTEKKEMVVKERRLFSSKDFSFKELIIDNYIPLMCILFSSDLFLEIGKFDESFDIYEDWDLLIRIAEKHYFFHIKEVTAEYVQWSSTYQIAQSPEFVEKSRNAHIQIIKKHKEKIIPEIFIELVLRNRELNIKTKIIDELEETRKGLEKIIREKEDFIIELDNIKKKLETELKYRDESLLKLESAKAEIEEMLSEKENIVENLMKTLKMYENELKEKSEITNRIEDVKISLINEIAEKNEIVNSIQEINKRICNFLTERKYLRDNQLKFNIDELKNHFKVLLEEKDKTIANLEWVKRNFERLLEIKEEAVESYKAKKENLEKLYFENEEKITYLSETVKNLENNLKEKDLLIANLNSLKIQLEQIIKEKDFTIINLEKMRLDYNKVVNNYEIKLKEKDDLISELKNNILDLKDSKILLEQILNSRGWKLLSTYYNLRDKILPENTKRRLIYNLLLLTMYNPKGMLKSLNKHNIKRFFSQYRILEPEIIESKVKTKVEINNIGLMNKFSRLTIEDKETLDINRTLSKNYISKESLLVVDRWVPTYDKDSGSLRMFNLLKILIELGYKITFLPDDLNRREPYVSELQEMGVEVIYGKIDLENYFKTQGMKFSIVILSRPEQAYKYLSLVRAYMPYAIVYYDTVDLHWLRFERAFKVCKSEEFAERAKYYKSIELFNASCSDVTITVTDNDKNFLLKENPELKVEVVPNIHEVIKDVKPFKERKDLLFVGGFLHQPNEDAVFYFVEEIFPKIKKSIPDVKFYVVGSEPSKSLLKINSEDIKVTGYVKDIIPFFENCRIFVSPLRFGAGMKGKIGQSMGYGLPVVTTTIGAEGIGLVHNENALIADRPDDFAKEVIRLYNDENLWIKISNNSIKHIEIYYSFDVIKEKIKKLFSVYKLQSV